MQALKVTPVQIDEDTLEDAAWLGEEIVGVQFNVKLPVELFVHKPFLENGQHVWRSVSEGCKPRAHTFKTIGVIWKSAVREPTRCDIYRLLGSNSGQNGIWGEKRWFWLAHYPDSEGCYYISPDSEEAAVKGLNAKIKRDVKKRLLG